MKSSQKYLLIIPLFSLGFCYAQHTHKETGHDNFDHYAYMVPIPTYEELSKKGYTVAEICKNLGNAYYLNAQYAEAALWYEKLFELPDKNTPPDYLYRYAQSLRSLEKYEESDIWMQKFENAKAHDSRVTKYLEEDGYLKELSETSQKYAVTNASGINSNQSDFAPSFHQNELVFSTLRYNGKKSKNRNETRYLNLFSSQLDTSGEFNGAALFSEGLSTNANESSTAFSNDGKTVYFTRNNSKMGLFKRDKQGISRLKIYRAKLLDGQWTEIEDLPFNSATYSTAHPSLSKDGSQLYFSSDMPGTKGASDIFVVTVNPDGSFGTPQNLGPEINTEGRETFPFISDSGVLYFSSDGHPGFGGLDIFSIDLKNHGKATNMGKPINSKEDDFSLIMDAVGKNGFFASNRYGGMGSDDLYSFKDISSCFTQIKGIVVDKDSQKPLSGALVTAQNGDDKKLAEAIALEDGTFTIEIECQKSQYQLVAIKDEYQDGALFMLTSPTEKNVSGAKLELEPLDNVVDVGTDLVKALKLTPIYFDLNSSYLRQDAYADLDKVVNYMQTRPDIKIEVGSHTDSRAGDAYNLWLSDRRAKRTVAYIVSKGIDPNRIWGKGYGETQLINHCSNGVPCSDADHQLNRRSEFIVVESSRKNE